MFQYARSAVLMSPVLGLLEVARGRIYREK